MRRIAEELGVTAMSLYRHVADKDELLDAILDQRLVAVGEPPVGLKWRPWMAASAVGLRSIFRGEPELLERYGRRPVAVPSALVRMERSLQVLIDAGFDGDGALDVFASVHTFTIGFSKLERSRTASRSGANGRTSIDETQPGFWPVFFGLLDPEQFPFLAMLQPDLVAFTSDERFERGLAALLRGFDPMSAPRRPRRPT